VLEFAVDPNDTAFVNDYWPQNYDANCVVYTGTHDNETLAGWCTGLSRAAKDQIKTYLFNPKQTDKDLWKAVLHLAMTSCARTCIIPIQDHLGLDNSCRMNQPGTVGINWRWRLLPGQVDDGLAYQVKALTIRANRANWDALNALKEREEAEAEETEE